MTPPRGIQSSADRRLSILTFFFTIFAMALILAEILTEVICTLQAGARHDRALWNRPFADLSPGAGRAHSHALADDDSVAKRASGSFELATV